MYNINRKESIRKKINQSKNGKLVKISQTKPKNENRKGNKLYK